MAMITCSECGRAVSNKAAACIGCGAPLSASHDVNFAMPAKVNAPPSPQQIKRRAALSLVLLVAGMAWASLVDHAHADHRMPVFLSALLIIGGICGLLLAVVHAMTSKP